MSSDGDKDVVEVGKPASPKAKRKKLIVIGAAAAVLLAGGGGAAMMMGGGEAKADAGHGEAAAEAADEGEGAAAEGGGHGGGAGPAAPFDVPPLLVNLRSPDGAPRFLKVHIMLVPGPRSSVETLKNEVPPLIDAYQPFLRELRPEDLAGSAAVFRIKEELILRARDTLGEGHVKDVLIQDLIQQ